MQAFEFYSPTKIIFGPDTETQVGQHIQAYGGTRVMVIYGGNSAVKSGLLDRVLNCLKEAGLPYETLGGVQPNPHLELAEEGVKKAISFGADFFLAVGGGSVIDTTKAVAIGAANPDVSLWDFWLRKVPLTTCMPLAAVLTIPAAGSESSDSVVLTRYATHEKRGLGSDLVRPRFSILNPELTYTLPPYQVICGIVDIMMHTMERYFNPITTNELTDEIAEGLLRTTIRNGKRAVANPGDYQAMSELMWAGALSHNGLTGAGGAKDFATHQLGHELSATFDCAHGATLSAVWDSWARYVMPANPARFAQFGCRVWGLDANGLTEMELAEASINATADFFHSIGMPITLGQLKGCGMQTEEQLDGLAYRCAFKNTRTIGTFKVLDHNDIRAIYAMANRP